MPHKKSPPQPVETTSQQRQAARPREFYSVQHLDVGIGGEGIFYDCGDPVQNQLLLASPENFVSALPNGEPFIYAAKLPGMGEINFDISDLSLIGAGLRPANSGQSIKTEHLEYT